MVDVSDQQLIGQYLSGDEKSLEFLVKRYLSAIYNFSYKFVRDEGEASDIAQETFVKAWRNLKRYNPKQKFTTWLFAIAKNCAIDHLRRKREIVFSALEDQEGNNDFVDNISDDELLGRNIAIGELESSISKLSKEQQVVLYLHYQQGQTFEEIAHILHESLNTTKSRHRRALLKLKEMLTK